MDTAAYVNTAQDAHASEYRSAMTDSMDPADKPRRLTRGEARRQTRERLLEAAAVVFNELGYNGASLDAVAEAAGYTKGAVYSNFATKADLFMALLESYVEQEAGTQAVQLQSGTIEEFIDGLDTTFERQTKADPRWVLLQVEFWLAAARDPAIRARYLKDAEKTRKESGKVLDRKLAEIGVTAPFTGRELGILLNALGTGLALDSHLEPREIDPKLFVRAARLLFGLGLKPGPGRR
jgi:AcrR family transcriptional regulator